MSVIARGALAAGVVFALWGGTAGAAVREVPQDYPTIQAAVDAANPGDEIAISRRQNFEDVTVTTNRLLIRGVRPGVVLDGFDNDLDAQISQLTINADRVRVQNLTFRGGLGISCIGSRCGFNRVRFRGAFASGTDCISVTGNGAGVRRSSLVGCADSAIEVSGNGGAVAGNTIAFGNDPCLDVSGNGHEIVNNRLRGCRQAGIEYNGNNTAITGNKVRDTDESAISAGGNRLRITGNTGASINDTCLDVSGDGARIHRNRLDTCRGGIHVEGQNPEVTGNRVLRAGEGYGIHVECQNNGAGAEACDSAEVSGNVAERALNGYSGILVQQPPGTGTLLIARNRALRNSGEGFDLETHGARIASNRAIGNGNEQGFGFRVDGDGNLYADNVARGNGGDGFFLASGGDGNRMRVNVARGNHGDGFEISVNTGSRLIRNEAIDNFAEGIDNKNGLNVVLRRNRAAGNRTDCVNDGTIAVEQRNRCADGSDFDLPGEVSRVARRGGADVREVPAEYPTIQAAVDAANAGDRIAISRRRNFENVTVSTNRLVIEGTRPGVFVDGYDDTSNDALLSFEINSDGVRVRNLGIRNGRGIDCTGARCGLDRVRFGGASEATCFAAIGSGARVRRSTFTACGGAGVRIVGNNTLVAGNRFANINDECVDLDGADVRVSDNGIRGCENGSGVEIAGSGAEITGNRITDIRETGIALTGDGARISGNRLENTGDTCVEAVGDGARIRSNSGLACANGGVFVQGQNPQLVGNSFVRSASAAMYEVYCPDNGGGASACTNTLIENNLGARANGEHQGFYLYQDAGTGGFRVIGNRAIDNTDYGIDLSGLDGARVTDNVVRGNGSNLALGIYLNGDDIVAVGNRSIGSNGEGIEAAGEGILMRNNVARGNHGDGFEISSGSDGVRAIGNESIGNFGEGFDNRGTDTVLRRNVARKNRTDCVNGGTIAVKVGNRCADGSNFNVPPEVG